MSSEIWGIVSAAGIGGGFDSCLQRRRLFQSSTAALISFSVNAAVPPSEKIFQSANLVFVLSGIIQPAIVRVMFYVGIVRLGVSRAGRSGEPHRFFRGDCVLLFRTDRS